MRTVWTRVRDTRVPCIARGVRVARSHKFGVRRVSEVAKPSADDVGIDVNAGSLIGGQLSRPLETKARGEARPYESCPVGPGPDRG